MRIRCLLAILLTLSAWPVVARPDQTEYLAVFMEGKKVGYAVHTRTLADQKVTTGAEVSITISRAGVAVTIKMTETSIETSDGKPLGFEVTQQLGAMVMKVVGSVNTQGVVNLTSMAMGAEQKSTLEWPKGAVMAEGLRLLELKEGLRQGAQYTATIFSPGILQTLETRINVGAKQDVDLLGRIAKLTEVTTSMTIPGAGEIISKSYVDDDLRALKTTVPIAGMQVEMVACAKEFALGENDVLELIEKMFISSPEPLEDVGSASSITYLLKPNNDAELTIPTTDSQKVKRLADGRVMILVKPASAPAGERFPYKGKDTTILEAIKPTRFLQSDQKEIIELARRAVGDTQDATEAARRIESFVARYVSNKSLSVGYASAAEVAAGRAGDCSEFAVLTAAMCRAVGIPAQMVVGVAYVKDFAGFQGFGGHAWAQAYIGEDGTSEQKGRWVSLDAAFKSSGLGGYDAGHIALAVGNGEPADFFNIATTLGQFKIEKVKVNRD